MPAQGAVIAPGPFQLAVTFDRPMAPGSYAFAHDAAEGPFPQCNGQPRLSPDQRTYTLDCVARAGERYVVYLNREPHIGFLGADTKTPAQPARLAFAVSADAAAPAPKVTRTVPAEGAVIGPGRFTLEVTFDRPMLPQAYSFVRSDEGLYPECPPSSPPLGGRPNLFPGMHRAPAGDIRDVFQPTALRELPGGGDADFG